MQGLAAGSASLRWLTARNLEGASLEGPSLDEPTAAASMLAEAAPQAFPQMVPSQSAIPRLEDGQDAAWESAAAPGVQPASSRPAAEDTPHKDGDLPQLGLQSVQVRLVQSLGCCPDHVAHAELAMQMG